MQAEILQALHLQAYQFWIRQQGMPPNSAGSSLLIKALSEQGDVSVVTSQESTVTNLTPGTYPDGRSDGLRRPVSNNNDYGCRSNNNINAGHDHHRIQYDPAAFNSENGQSPVADEF
ncbi:type IVB pilus formation outer membrane protein, R64 PilN family [Escherichia coli]|uniref:Type IVB pilus formation outer membrane protein, R64 PilN family n=1 Tax=Escherichia coli TaxID=562 RepID=A0A376ZYA5_ECOLX|nr:type IVB pilus formation outer membrane protein, R64 PilN family [Escherichia coli]